MKFFKKIVPLLLVMALLATITVGCGNNSSSEQKDQPENKSTSENNIKKDYFVDVAWLKNNMQNVIILDARKDTEYKVGHISGAINAPWQSFANMQGKPGDTGWGVVLPKEKLAEKLGALGISSDKEIVIYADPNAWGEDGRILWMLRMAGLRNTKLLDGGWPAWKNDKGETSNEVPTLKPAQLSIATYDESMTATTDYIKANKNKIKIVDARAKKEYDGAKDFGEKRGGHLPGAINLPFKEVYNDDGTVKSVPELKKLFADAGLKPEDEIVTYCTKGIRSAHMAMILRMAGYENARNYDASFYEWAGNESLSLDK